MFIKKRDKTAFIWKDREISYTELLSYIEWYARLYDAKIEEKAVIYMENRPQWGYAFYSAWKKKLLVVPVDFMSTPKEVAYILSDCRPKTAFCSQKTRKVMEEAIAMAGVDIQMFDVDELTEPEELPEGSEIAEPDANETAVIIYTSGTTGSPKGVMLSFENLLVNIDAVTKDVPLITEDDRMLIFLPLHHTFPLAGSLIAPLFVGSVLVFSPSMDAPDIVKTLENNRVTIIEGVPRFYTLLRNGIMAKINKSAPIRLLFKLAEKIGSGGFSRKIFSKVHKKFGGHVKHLICGGAAVDIQVEKDFRTLGFSFLSGYGMTEAAPIITFPRPDNIKPGSTGQPLKCNEVKIEDGEILTRGPNIMQGYYNRPEETAEIMKGGWLHTGDLGHMDEDNHLFITGRKKEIIILPSGKNVNPVEIELQLESCPGIDEIGVFMYDNTLQAIVVPQEKNPSTFEEQEKQLWQETIEPYNQSVSPYKKIQKITLFQGPLPRTRLDKVKRFKLHELITKKDVSLEAEPDFKEYKVIKEFLQDRTQKKISSSDRLRTDLGLDSLDQVSLLFFLKNSFGLQVDESLLEKYPTLKELSLYVKKKSVKMTLDTVSWTKILKEKITLKLPGRWFTLNMIKNLARRVFKLFYRLTIKGNENIPKGPCIIAANHQSFLDALIVAAGLSNKQMSHTYFYAKAKHIKPGWFRYLSGRNHIIIVDIGKELKLSLQKLAAVLRNGGKIIIFPEGTRTTTGSLLEFKKTFAILSRELKVPIIPAVIKGAYDVWPYNRTLPRLGKKVSLDFLEKIEGRDLSANELSRLVMEKIRKKLQ